MSKSVSLEEFKLRVKQFGSKTLDIDYSTYKGVSKRIRVRCHEHNIEWHPVARSVGPAKGQKKVTLGCVQCGIERGGEKRRISKGNLLERCTDKHGNRFNYKETDFSKGMGRGDDPTSFVKIICNKHPTKSLEICLNDHLRYENGGCDECDREWQSERQRMSVEEFKEKGSKKYKSKYGYDLVHSFRNQHERVWIECPIQGHGVFPKSPANHLHKTRPQGCPKCGTKRGAEKLRSNTSEFIEKALKVHGIKYDYSAVEYVKSDKKVRIICPDHGEFPQTPNDHLDGCGCDTCGKIASAAAQRTLTTEIVVERCKQVWGDQYDYSIVEYIPQKKFNVICKVEGHPPFPVTLDNHVGLEKGCPRCGHKRRAKQNAWLNSLSIPDDNEHREKRIDFDDGSRVFADGYDPETNTVYEFWGDMWHGNPKLFPPDKIIFGISMAERYSKTQIKRRKYFEHGFKLIEIWEHEWDSAKG